MGRKEDVSQRAAFVRMSSLDWNHNAQAPARADLPREGKTEWARTMYHFGASLSVLGS